jgi:transposase InsO family protein
MLEGGPKLAPSTITGILRRGALLNQTALPPRPFQRFERAAPNELWQMDFKGNFPFFNGARCHPLTVLDDHSRFSVLLQACADEREQTVRAVLTEAFRRYGLPAAMLMDNGSPWGAAGAQPFTAFSLWLIRLGIRVAHGRPYHPQTQGKDERFHRTLKFEVLRHFNFTSLEHCQREFDSFRHRYNLVRPHDALGLATPVTRYRPSPIPFPESVAAHRVSG